MKLNNQKLSKLKPEQNPVNIYMESMQKAVEAVS